MKVFKDLKDTTKKFTAATMVAATAASPFASASSGVAYGIEGSEGYKEAQNHSRSCGAVLVAGEELSSEYIKKAKGSVSRLVNEDLYVINNDISPSNGDSYLFVKGSKGFKITEKMMPMIAAFVKTQSGTRSSVDIDNSACDLRSSNQLAMN